MRPSSLVSRTAVLAFGFVLFAFFSTTALAQAQNPWDLLGITPQPLDPSQTVFVGEAQQTKVFVSDAAVSRMANWGVVSDKRGGLKIKKMANRDLPDLVPFLSSDPKDPNADVYVIAYDNSDDAALGAVPEVRVVAFRKSGGVAQTRIFKKEDAYTYQVLPFQKKPSFLNKAWGRTKDGAGKVKEKAEKIRKP